MHYLLVYEIAGDYLERRVQFREAHLRLAWEAAARGELVLGGAVGDPVEGAMLLFRADSPAVAENFATCDPYVTNGLVVKWRVQPWSTVVGDDAANPIRVD
jgi:uncharacterized protein YciI